MIFNDSSLSWSGLTSEGASLMRQAAFSVFGKAMTSRIDSAPAMIMIRRSRPKAIPPWGGAPYCKASRKNPNFVCT